MQLSNKTLKYLTKQIAPVMLMTILIVLIIILVFTLFS
jgi:hypothetical protein